MTSEGEIARFLMATGRELVLRNSGGGCSLKEEMAKVTLRNIRNKGHPYVELRGNGKRLIYFCVLCLSPCYGETTLHYHLNGHLHAQRFAGAKLTLFGPMPWPFNDGVFFFHHISEEEQWPPAVSNLKSDRILIANGDNGGTIVNGDHDKSLKAKNDGRIGLNGSNGNLNLNPNGIILGLSCDAQQEIISPNENNRHLVIPSVLVNNEISILGVSFIGNGRIAAKILETNEMPPKVRRIWCSWLGEGDSADKKTFVVPQCDFSIVTFSYTYDLGRKSVVSDLGLLLSSRPGPEIENCGSNKRKRRRLFSGLEDMHDMLSDDCSLDFSNSGAEIENPGNNEKKRRQSFSEPEDMHGTKGDGCNLYEDQLQEMSLVLSREDRRQLRRQQRLAAERDCDICKQTMLPGKDVATLLNRKTGNLACSSRNMNGAFHVFHISCLTHWLLLCELEMLSNQSTGAKSTLAGIGSKPGRKGRAKSSKRQMNDGRSSTGTYVSSAFCPECQGTGLTIKGDELEKPTVPLSEIFLYKIKAIQAHKEWVKSPEILQKCSTGLHFPSAYEENSEEKVLPLKSLRFYRALE